MKKTIYTANPKTHFFKELSYIFKDIRESQFLAFQTAKRDIQAQYRQSFLGMFWALAPVISQAAVWIFINKSGAVKFGETETPYPLFAIIGITLWTIFTDAVNSPIKSINQARGVISKINFPKEGLIVAGIYKFMFDAFIKLLLVIVFLIYFQITPSFSLLLFPVILIITILLGTTIGIMIAPIGLLYSDIARAMTMFFSFLMFLTPVVYPQPRIGSLSFLFDINPLTPLIVSGRNCLTGYDPYGLDILYWLLPIIIVLLCVGLVIFRNSMNILIEKIS